MPISAFACLMAGTALAGGPVPDRPMSTPGGYLVEARSLELEIGALWMDGMRVPARVKFAAGKVFEPRVGFDLSGLDQGRPGLLLEGKFGLIQKDKVGLAAMVGSAFPVADEERWSGALDGLVSVPIKDAELRARIGLALAGKEEGHGVAFAGVPLSAALALPFGGGVGAFLEAGTVLESGWDRALFDGGLTWRLTEILVLDGAFGWDLAADGPFAAAGFTASLGRIGG